jgi:hypothetical protein
MYPLFCLLSTFSSIEGLEDKTAVVTSRRSIEVTYFSLVVIRTLRNWWLLWHGEMNWNAAFESNAKVAIVWGRSHSGIWTPNNSWKFIRELVLV